MPGGVDVYDYIFRYLHDVRVPYLCELTDTYT